MATALVGSTLLRTAPRRRTHGRAPVRRVATLATDAIDERGEVVDGELLTSDIRRLWKLGHFRSRSVVVGLSSPSIATCPVEFPKVPAEDAAVGGSVRGRRTAFVPARGSDRRRRGLAGCSRSDGHAGTGGAAPASTIATVASGGGGCTTAGGGPATVRGLGRTAAVEGHATRCRRRRRRPRRGARRDPVRTEPFTSSASCPPGPNPGPRSPLSSSSSS